MNLDHLEKIQTLTKKYAAYSRSAIGLGYLVAALLLPILFFVARALPLSLIGAVLGGLLCFASIGLWLWLRQEISSKLYQGFGVALAPKPIFDTSWVLGIGAGALIATGLVWLLRSSGLMNFPNTYLFAAPAFVISGIAAWRDYKERSEQPAFATFFLGSVVGTGFYAQADNLADFQRTIQLVLLVLIPVGLSFLGIREHLEFKRLETEFKTLSGTP